MKRSNNILQFTAFVAVICSQCFVQSIVAQNGREEEDRPLTAREVRRMHEKTVIPLDKYLMNTKKTLAPVTAIAAGTYEVGDDQPILKKLTDVADQLNSGIITGDVIYELNSTYDGTSGEILPVVFNEFTFDGGTWTVTIRVKSGVTNRSTSEFTNSPLIVFNGTDHLILDGRPGGIGDAVEWNFHNSYPDGTGILFINDARYNTVRNCDLISLNKNLGVITFGPTSFPEGNDNNTIAYCNIHDDNGSDSPGYGIYSAGNTSDENSFNSGNSIENCNIYNIFHDDDICESIFLEEGSTGWNISGNSFYQTLTRVTSGYDLTLFNVIDIMSGDGYIVLNNYIGGSAPQCGGTPWTVEGTTTPKTFYGISYYGRSGPNPNLTEGNTITNIIFKYAYPSSFTDYQNIIIFTGILVINGVHNIINNTVGSSTENGAIVCETGPTINGNLFGLYYTQASGGLIDNNVFGGITVATDPIYSGGQTTFDIYGLRVNQVANTIPLFITHNLAGSPATPNSIQGTITGSSGNIRIYGLYVTSAIGQAEMNVMENTAANMIVNGNTAGCFVRGILVTSNYPGAQISGNVVHDLTNNTPGTSPTLSTCSMLGMHLQIYSPAVVSRNEIYNLKSSFYQVVMAGCYVQNGPSSAPGTIERNFIHNLSNNLGTANSQLYGLNIGQGNFNIINNMISLGTNPDGSPMLNSSLITGIHEQAGSNNYYNNSVYIGGMAPAGTTAPTACFNSYPITTARIIKNNIFFNARSGGSSNKHYAMRFTNLNPLIVTSNNNILLANGTGGMLAYSATNYSTLEEWKTATGQDMSSGTGDPNFINPQGTPETTNLHVMSPTPAEGSGVMTEVVTTDYDGESRSSLTPSDIGADAGNFTSGPDIFGPAISYTPLSNSPTINRLIGDFAVITDNDSVGSLDNAPRFYFKKSTDANAFAGNTSGDNGWKFVTASNTVSPYTFELDYSLLYGGTVSNQDIIQYFVVAQDVSNNMNSLPPGATASANPPVQNISAAPVVTNQYLVTDQLIGGMIHIPMDFPTLTGAGGLFEKINQSLVTSDIFVFIDASLNEPGTNGLNQFSTYPEGKVCKMSMYPVGPVMCVVSGSEPSGLIRFNGADNITIGGNYGFQGTFLKFINTSSTGPVFSFTNDVHSVTLKELIIEGANTSTNGLIFIGGSNQPSGNHDIMLSYNRIRNISTGPGIPWSMITSTGTPARENHDITIYKNELFNFSGYGINITSTGNGSNWIIENNHLYCNKTLNASSTQYGIYLGAGAASSGNIIEYNFVGGTGPETGFGQWITDASTFYAIAANVGTECVNTLQYNYVNNILMNNSSSAIFNGINVTGWFNAIQNTVGGFGESSIIKEASGAFYGINITGPFDKINEIHYNTVASILINGTSGNNFFMYVTGHVNMSYNQVGIPDGQDIETKTGSNTMGIYTNIRGYLGHNSVGGILQSNQDPGYFYGVYLTNSYPKMMESNQILNCGPGSSSIGSSNISGIYNSLTGSGTSSYINNVISLGHGFSNTNAYMGIYDAAPSANSEFFFNSVSLGGSSPAPSSSFAYYKDGKGSSILKDNIFANFRTGPVHQCAVGIAGVATESIIVSDYNDLYSVSGEDVFRDMDQYMDLEKWQTSYGMDIHSVSADPLFHSSVNLRPCSPELLDAGVAIPPITTDFAENLRSDPPDIGAFEFTLPLASITTGTPDDFCNGELLTAHSTTDPSTFLWSTGSTDQSIFLNISENEEGTYSVYAIDENGCSSVDAAEYTYSPEDLVSSYTILGLLETQLAESNTVLNGAVGLTGAGLTAYLKKNVVVNGPGSFVKASKIDAHPTAIIREKIYSPVRATLPAMQYNNTTGNFTNVNVPGNTTITISTNYINLTAGQNCRITLNGNIFGNIQADKGTIITFSSSSLNVNSLRSLPGTAAAPVKFVFTDDAVMRVKTRVDLDNYVNMNPDQKKVIFYIGQQTGNPGLLQIKPTGTVFNGSAYVPAGMIKVSTDGMKNSPGQINGKFIAGRMLAGGKYVIWNWYDCSGGNQAPAAVPLFSGEPVQNRDEDMTVSPVPNDGCFRIRLKDAEDEEYTIRIFNIMGAEIRQIRAAVTGGVMDEQIDLRPVPAGVYNLVVMNDNVKMTKKILVVK